MTMHPELEHAFNSGAPMREVIEIFRKYYGGPRELKLDYMDHSEDFNSHEFWNRWIPLQRALPLSFWSRPDSVSEPFLSIHRALTREVMLWLCDSKRKSNIYLITERLTPTLHAFADRHPKAVVLANICSDAQRLGLFFHYHNTHSTIYRIIQALVELHHPYRRILTRILIDNPGIHKLPPRTLFKKLIHGPWKTLQVSHPQYVTAPPVIVLRWEYEGKDDCEDLRSLCELGLHSSPLLWIISVDPKIRLPIPDVLDPQNPYIRPPVCYSEASADASLVLHHEFSALRDKHKEISDDKVWPSEEQMSQLIRVVSGVVEFVDVIIKFIDWDDDGGPQAHLETFLAYMVDSPSPSDEQPYCSLDHFYIRVLSDFPPDLFVVVKKIFGIFCCLGGRPGLTLPELFGLLSLERDTFVPYFKRLVGESSGWFFQNLCVLLWGFLQDPSRSGHFHMSESEARLHASHPFLHVLARCSNFTTLMNSLEFLFSEVDQKSFIYQIHFLRRFALDRLYNLGYSPVEWSLLRRFDFRCLAHTSNDISSHEFVELLKRLHRLDLANSVNIVRVRPTSPLDKRFIDKCEGLAEPLDIEGEAEEEEAEEDEWSFSVPKYVLLGYETETVLIVLAPWETNVARYHGTNVYTSAMLDYM